MFMPLSSFHIPYPPNGWSYQSRYYYRELVNFLDSLDIFTYESGYYPEPSGSSPDYNSYTYFTIKGSTNKLRLWYQGDYCVAVMKKNGTSVLYTYTSLPLQYQLDVLYNSNVFRFLCNSQVLNVLIDNAGNPYVDGRNELTINIATIGMLSGGKIIMDGEFLSFPCYIGIDGEFSSNRYIPNLFQVHQGSTFNYNQLLIMDGVQSKVHPTYTNMIMTL